MESLPIAGENGFVDLSVSVTGPEVNHTAGLELPPGFMGWVRCEVKGTVTTGDAETGVWLAHLKVTAVRLGEGTVDIKASSAHLPGYDFMSGNASNYEVALVRHPTEAERVCIRVAGGAEGDTANFDCRFFPTGARP